MKLADILTGPETWCKGSLAKTKAGEHVGIANPDAVQFCLRGGVLKSSNQAGWSYTPEDKIMCEVFADVFPEKAVGLDPKDRNYTIRAVSALVAFNNHPDTTFDDIKPLIKAYDHRMATKGEAVAT